jgi:hypothetical protein
MQRGTHRNRVRVRVRSFVDLHVLQYVSEHEGRIMCGENSDGSRMIGCDGKPIEAVARRLSRLKASFTDIQLMASAKSERASGCSLSQIDVQNNAFAQAFSALGETDSISALERATAKVGAWPDVHDDRAVVISAGKAYGVIRIPIEENRA